MNHKVFVVTGGRQGIGLSICRQLAVFLAEGDRGGVVYIVDRDDPCHVVTRSQAEGLKNVVGYQVDITDRAGVKRFRDFLENQHGGVDCIINNAAVAFKRASQVPFPDQVAETLRVNFYGTQQVCEELFPLLRKDGRVVITSSNQVVGTFYKMSRDLKMKFLRPDLSILDLKQLMLDFELAAREGTLTQNGWVESAYATTKIALTFLATIYQQQFDRTHPSLAISVNSYDPGHCQTSMSSYTGDRTPDQGADTAVYLATLEVGESSPKGKLLFERKVVPFPSAGECL